MEAKQLEALAHELQTQDNEFTAYPIFVVKQTRRITGLDPDYVEDYCFMDEEGKEIDIADEGLTEEQAEETDWLTKVYYSDELEVVNFHFTRKSADKFIAKYGYNYNKPCVIVESLHRCFEMIDIRNWLLSGEPAQLKENAEAPEVKKLYITDAERLDPITVYLEDYELGKGQITIVCWGKSWTAFWCGMGSRTIAQFFCACDKHYLLKNLDSELSYSLGPIDQSKVMSATRKIIAKRFREGSLDKKEFLGLIEDLSFLDPQEVPHSVNLRNGLDYDWTSELPRLENKKVAYLLRIIEAVKAGLQKELEAA